MKWAMRIVNIGGKRTSAKSPEGVLKAGDIIYVSKSGESRFRLQQPPKLEGALVAMDPHTGRVLAMVGGFSYAESEFNRATQAYRQPGSSFKPFVYSAAFEHGFTPATVVNDAPPDVGYQPTLERVWRPENFGGKYFGPSRLREALRESMNAVSIRILQSIGVPAAVEHVKRFGFDDTAVPDNLSLALGGLLAGAEQRGTYQLCAAQRRMA